jgi:hypothetical protein
MFSRKPAAVMVPLIRRFPSRDRIQNYSSLASSGRRAPMILHSVYNTLFAVAISAEVLGAANCADLWQPLTRHNAANKTSQRIRPLSIRCRNINQPTTCARARTREPRIGQDGLRPYKMRSARERVFSSLNEFYHLHLGHPLGPLSSLFRPSRSWLQRDMGSSHLDV